MPLFGFLEGATPAIAAASAAIGLWQYRRNSRQAMAIKAADEMEFFHTDNSVLTAQRLIDYSACYITIEKSSKEIQEVPVRPMDFHLALRHHLVPRTAVAGYKAEKDAFASERAGDRNANYQFSEKEHYIRDAFDGFLGRLERVESLISNKVVAEADFRDHFSYWIRLIGDPKTAGDNFSADKRQTLIDYINSYEFNGVIRLFARYDKDLSLQHKPVAPATQP